MSRQPGIGLLVSALILLAACSGDGPVEPSAGDYRILFASDPSGSGLLQIYAMDPDGSRLETVLPEPGVYEELQASPDGRKVLLIKTHGAEPLGARVLDVESATIQALPEVGPGYTWSPDGGRIATRVFVPAGRNPDGTQRPPTHRVLITNAAGIPLATFPQENAVYTRMSWSPDGQELVYTRSILVPPVSFDVVRAQADGSEITNISNSADFEGDVAWSPTAPLIALVAVRDEQGGIFTMRPDGSELTHRYSGIVTTPRWSPDGGRLLFIEDGLKLVVLSLFSGGTTVVATGAIQGGSPFWSPDGRWITYGAAGDAAGELDVYVVKPDGSSRRNLTAGSGRGRSPVWVHVSELE